MSRVINLARGLQGSPSSNSLIIENLTNLFKKYGSTPGVSSASLLPIGSGQKSCYKLTVNWSQTDFDSVEKISFLTNYLINPDEMTVTDMKVQQDTTSESYSVVSNDGKLKAVVRDVTKDGKSNQVVEIWSNKSKVKTINGDKEKSFGKIHLSATLGSISWSLDGSQLMFIAEKHVTTSGYFGDKKKNDEKKGDSKDDDDSDVKTTGLGEEYHLKEDWGEQLEGSCHPVIVVADSKDNFKMRIIDLPDVSCSESFWIDNKTIGFVGIKEETRRLGLIFCPIRRSCLYKCDLRDPESEPVPIYGQDFDLAIRSPRSSNDSKKIVFLSNPPAGPHFQASELKVLNLSNLKVRTLIDTGSATIDDVNNPTGIQTFYDLYLPKRCWTRDDSKIIVTSDVRYRNYLFLVDIENGQSTHLPVDGCESVSVLDFRDELVVLNLTKPNLGSNLHVGKLVDNQLIQLTCIDPDLVVNREEIDYKCETVEKVDPTSGRQLITCIIIGPKESFSKPSPSILIPHGGPHSAYMATYMPYVGIMAEAGFKVLLVNYRGSVGVNSEHEKFLCGKVGTTDVSDCMEVLNKFIKNKEVDKDQVYLYGGSHGGFLVTHLVGQHSDFGFRACVALNPVTDLAVGFSTSDIPDWHLVEGFAQFEPYSLDTIPTPELLKVLLSKSPISHIDKVKTPVLMVVGTKDKRVAMCQGLAYYYGLKSRGVKTKCLLYEDNHSISKINHDLDVDMNSIFWFLDHSSL